MSLSFSKHDNVEYNNVTFDIIINSYLGYQITDVVLSTLW